MATIPKFNDPSNDYNWMYKSVRSLNLPLETLPHVNKTVGTWAMQFLDMRVGQVTLFEDVPHEITQLEILPGIHNFFAEDCPWVPCVLIELTDVNTRQSQKFEILMDSPLLGKLQARIAELEKLLPCPFCGSTEIRSTTPDDDPDEMYAYVYCYNCGAQGGQRSENRQVAIAFWNTRKGHRE